MPESMGDFMDQFYAWMAKSGNRRLEGETWVPRDPMSPRTCANRIRKLRPILRDLGYLIHIRSPRPGRPRWVPNPRRDILRLRTDEVVAWFGTKFPPGDLPPHRRGLWNDYASAFRLFADFLHYGLGVWSQERLEEARGKVRLRGWYFYPEVDIVEPRKALAFQGWLERQPRYYSHAIMLYLMQWLGLRYIEVIKARASLDGPTLRVDWERRLIMVWGKGRGGLSKVRYLPLTSAVGQKLRGYQRWHRSRGISSPWLFVNSHGHPLSEDSWGYNKLIRSTCLPRYNRWVRERGRPDEALSEDEIRRMTTHRMGRHVFGTIYAAHMPPKTLMEYMGIKHFYVARRYINFSKEEKVQQFERATRAIVGGASGGGRKLEPDMAGIIEQLKTLSLKGRELAWLNFLEGLMGLLATDWAVEES